VLILVPRCFLKRFVPGFLFLIVFGVLVPGVRVLGVAIGGPGGFRLSRLLQACELWLASYS
jgi:hypothetical protein